MSTFTPDKTGNYIKHTRRTSSCWMLSEVWRFVTEDVSKTTKLQNEYMLVGWLERYRPVSSSREFSRWGAIANV